MLHIEDLQALAQVEAAHAVSAYLPTHAAGPETRQDPIRLKNLLDQAASRLHEAGHRRPDIEAVLAPARELLADTEFWRHQDQGLVVFMAPDFFRCERLPIEVDETLVVGRRLYLKPLLPLLAGGERFLLLAVSARQPRLFLGSRFDCHEVSADFPHGVGQISAESEYDNESDAAPPARPRTAGHVGMPASHNAGETPEEQRKAQLIQYLRRVLHVVEEYKGASPMPLVLVAQPEIQGHLRALAKGQDSVEGGVEADPEALDRDDLHRRAWKLVEPVLASRHERETERFTALLNDGDAKASTVPEDIVVAAHEGRVETLLLAQGEQLWGQLDAFERRVAVQGGPDAEAEELLDRAALETVLQGGRVELLPKSALPRPGLIMAAILRY